MSRHEGVSCDACLKSNFSGLRYKCLVCYDYDLCATCYSNGATSSRHTTDHAMQCILTRADINLYYGGDTSVTNQPQSYACSYCGRMGFTVVLLQEHIRAAHGDAISTEVVCPVCAAHPGGDPNHVTDDLATHIALVHRSGTEFEDDQLSGIRQIRRLTHPVRTSNFGSRPNRGPVMQLIEPPSTGMSPTGRDSMDPIAELLSQLTSVRSRAAIAQGMTSHLQQIEMHLASAKHQTERMSQRQVDSTKTTTTSQARSATSDSQSAAAKPSTAPSTGGSASSNARSQFLLVRCNERTMPDAEKQQHELENADKSLFVQELYLSSLIDGFSTEHGPLPTDSSPVEHSSPFTQQQPQHVYTSPTDSSLSPLMNGENVSQPYPATAKSCNVGRPANDRIWDLSDAENENGSSPADTSDNEAEDDEEEAEERGSAATETLQKESRLL